MASAGAGAGAARLNRGGPGPGDGDPGSAAHRGRVVAAVASWGLAGRSDAAGSVAGPADAAALAGAAAAEIGTSQG